MSADDLLPPVPPKVSNKDFDPATYPNDEDAELYQDQPETRVQLSSVEINILIYLYLTESNLTHTAFALLSETNLPQTSLFKHYNPSYPTPSSNNKGKAAQTPNGNGNSYGRPEGRIPGGELVKRLWKSLRWDEIERHIGPSGETPTCPNPFHLLIPHTCPPSYPSSSKNPKHPLPANLRISSPPPKRLEAFPAPPVNAVASSSTSHIKRPNKPLQTQSAEAGPSNPNPKRKGRISTDSGRSPSPIKSNPKDKGKEKEKEREDPDSRPSSRQKKKARISNAGDEDKDGMDVDENPAVSRAQKAGSSKKSPVVRKSELSVPEEVKRPKSPLGRPVVDDPPGPHHLHVSTFADHRDAVMGIGWNPKNPDVLATASYDGTGRLYDFNPSTTSRPSLTKSKPPQILSHKSHDSSKNPVTALSWHPDGTILATASIDGVGRLFTPSGQLQSILSYGRGSIRSIKFSPLGSMILASKDDFTVTLWAIGHDYNQNMIRSYDNHEPGKPISDVEWLDESVWASCAYDRCINVQIVGEKKVKMVLRGHGDDVNRIKWSEGDGNGVHGGWEKRLLASVGDDGFLCIWKLPFYPSGEGKGSVARSVKSGGGGSRAGSPIKHAGGGVAVVGEGGGSDDDAVNMFESDGTGGAGGGSGIGKDKGEVRYLHKIRVIGEEESKDARMDAVAWLKPNESGQMIVAAAGQDTTVKLYDALKGELLFVLPGMEGGTGTICSFGTLVAAGGWEGKVVIWDSKNGEKVKEYTMEEEEAKYKARDRPMMLTTAWRKDGEQLAVGTLNKLVLTVYTGDLAERGGWAIKGKGKGKAKE